MRAQGCFVSDDEVRRVVDFLKENVPGLVGWMLLKPLGVSAIGSFQFAPDEAIQAVSTLGANPPDYRTNYGDTWKLDRIPPIPPEKPTNYLVHMEWESPQAAQAGLAMAFTSPALRKIHKPAGPVVSLANVPAPPPAPVAACVDPSACCC